MKDAEVQRLLASKPHLREYVEKIRKKMGVPQFYKTLTRDMAEITDPNLIYPVSDDVFVHVYRDPETGELVYAIIEPKVREDIKDVYDRVLQKIVELAADVETLNAEEVLEELTRRAFKELKLPEELFPPVYYNLRKNLIGYGIWDAFFHDEYLEDVRNAGLNTYVVHKIWHNMRTNISFPDEKTLDLFAFDLGLRMNKRVSTTKPIIDGILPKSKARVNIIFGKEVSKSGTSISIRLVEREPMSIIDIIDLKTMTPELAAYLWLAIENGMSIFFCGPTASGKTTTMRAAAVFIKPDAKVYSVEDTPEVYVPHRNWQATVAKEGRADMFDLLKASLRSRPNYIIVGEIRGREGNIAFQAMQTGHPVMSTFHGGNIKKIIQRLTGPPINVPPPYITNLNIVVIQRAFRRGERIVRRVTSVHEIESYVEGKGILTREVFRFDPIDDRLEFIGRFNSYILEKKIALFAGYAEPREIYKELDTRAKILEEMRKRGMHRYHDVWNIVKSFYYFGVEGLPFPLEEV